MKPIVGWVIIACLVAAVFGALFVLKDATSGVPLDVQFATTTFPSASSTEAAATSTDSLQEPPPVVPDGYMEYKSDDYHFSVYYPGDMTQQESRDGGSTTVAFQKQAGEQGFRIYVAPINGTSITEGRFKLDEPSNVRRDVSNGTVDGVQAVTFHGRDAQIGDTYEVWFIRDGLLYEVSTYKQLEPWLNEILRRGGFFRMRRESALLGGEAKCLG